MAAPRIKYYLEGTINLENFENIRVGFGLEADIQDGESKEDAVTRIADFVERNWQDRVVVAVDKFRSATS